MSHWAPAVLAQRKLLLDHEHVAAQFNFAIKFWLVQRLSKAASAVFGRAVHLPLNVGLPG
jgi:hypothetical protein